MTTTITRTVESSTPAIAGSTRSLWRTGAKAGICAAAAATAVAAVARAAGVSLEASPGEAVPLLGFAQLTLFFTLVGVVIARTIGGRSGRPRATLVRTTVALTALSLVPDVLLSAGAATKVTFMLTHLVAAAIVIPALSSCVAEQRIR